MTPETMRKWSYNSTSGGIENKLSLLTSEPLPKPAPSEHLVQILAVGLNPVDYKPAEAPLMGRFAVPKPATPGFDISGRIVVPAAHSTLKPSQLVYGAASTNALVGGGLAEYVAIPTTLVSALRCWGVSHAGFAGWWAAEVGYGCGGC